MSHTAWQLGKTERKPIQVHRFRFFLCFFYETPTLINWTIDSPQNTSCFWINDNKEYMPAGNISGYRVWWACTKLALLYLLYDLVYLDCTYRLNKSESRILLEIKRKIRAAFCAVLINTFCIIIDVEAMICTRDTMSEAPVASVMRTDFIQSHIYNIDQI